MNPFAKILFEKGELYYTGVGVARSESAFQFFYDPLIDGLDRIVKGSTVSYVKALHYYQLTLLHEPSHKQANERLGDMYYDGNGCERSFKAANAYFREAVVTPDDASVLSDGCKRADVAWGSSAFWEGLGDESYYKDDLRLATEAYELSINTSREASEIPNQWSTLQLAKIAIEENKPLLAIQHIRESDLDEETKAPYLKTTSAWKDMADGFYKKERYQKAVLHYQCALVVATESDQENITKIATRLGEMYYFGKNRSPSTSYQEQVQEWKEWFQGILGKDQSADIAKAIYYYRKALEGSDQQADIRLNRIGVNGHYRLGLNASTKEEAVRHWQWAAFAGYHIESMVLLGQAYKYGSGVKRSALVAAQWLESAIERGSEEARQEYGDLLYWEERFEQFFRGIDKSGATCEKNYAEALYSAEWMLIHTDITDRHAVLMKIADLHESNYKGVSQNLGKALLYYMAAEAASKNIEELNAAQMKLSVLRSNQWLLSQLTQHGPQLVWMAIQLYFFGWKKALSVSLQAASMLGNACLPGDMNVLVQIGLMVASVKFEKSFGLIDQLGSLAIGGIGQIGLPYAIDYAYPGIQSVDEYQQEIVEEQAAATKVRTDFFKLNRERDQALLTRPACTVTTP